MVEINANQDRVQQIMADAEKAGASLDRSATAAQYKERGEAADRIEAAMKETPELVAQAAQRFRDEQRAGNQTQEAIDDASGRNNSAAGQMNISSRVALTPTLVSDIVSSSQEPERRALTADEGEKYTNAMNQQNRAERGLNGLEEVARAESNRISAEREAAEHPLQKLMQDIDRKGILASLKGLVSSDEEVKPTARENGNVELAIAAIMEKPGVSGGMNTAERPTSASVNVAAEQGTGRAASI